MVIKPTFLLTLLLLSAALTLSTRPEPTGSPQDKTTRPDKSNGGDFGMGGGFLGPGGGFDIPGVPPGWSNGGGYGAGYGGPKGGYGKGGVIRTSVVCKDVGPCYKKRVTCPAKCFKSYSRSGKGYGGGGGGGSCTIDCKKKCTAYC